MLTFSDAKQTMNVANASIKTNPSLWSGTSPWALNNANSAVISLFDNGGVEAEVTFAAAAGAAWGEINPVNGSIITGITMNFGGNMQVGAYGIGTMTILGTNALIVGEQGTGTLNVLTGGLVDVQSLFVGHSTTENGTLKAKASAANFFPGFTNTQLNVESGGAIIDTNEFDIGVTQSLTGGATTGGELTKQGNGILMLNTGASLAGRSRRSER